MEPKLLPLSPRASTIWRAVATAQLADAGMGDPRAWHAVGEDPQFALLPPSLPLPAGWYRLRARMPELHGRLVNPCLYPDYGEGIAETTRIDLGLIQASAMLDTVVHFAQPLHALRFDPTTEPAIFRLDDFSALAVSMREALWFMLRACLAPLLEEDPAEAFELAQTVRTRRDTEGVEAALAELAPHYLRVGDTGANAYATWADRADRLLHDRLTTAAEQADKGDRVLSPLFSVLVHEEAGVDCSAALASLWSQHETDFELVLGGEQARLLGLTEAIGCPNGAPLRVVADGDSLAVRLAAAKGNFVHVLGASDRLHSHALGMLRLAVQAYPEGRLFYSDEDRLDAAGRRGWPYFKPAWDPLLFLEHDFIGRSALVRRDARMTDQLASLDPRAPWFDICAEIAVSDGDVEVVHVPHVLRHNLSGVGSASVPFAGQESDIEARADILRRHLRKLDMAASIEVTPTRVLRARHAPVFVSVDIIIPTRDRIDLLSQCVATLVERTTYPNYRIIIVDNGSEQPESHAYFSKVVNDPRVRVLSYDQPFNYSAINNFAAAQSDADLLVLLNNDIEVLDGGWLDELAALAVQPGIGAVGAKLYYPDGTLQHAGVILGVGGVAAHAYAHAAHAYPGKYGRALFSQHFCAVTAACLAIRRSVYAAVGGLDETISVAFNDVDFCLRVQALGYRNAWTPHAQLIHHESASRGLEDNPVKQGRFAAEIQVMVSRWSDRLREDDAYSPNLSLQGPPFTVDPNRHATGVVRRANLAQSK